MLDIEVANWSDILLSAKQGYEQIKLNLKDLLLK